MDNNSKKAHSNFDQSQLDSTVIALPLLKEMEESKEKLHDVVIDLNLLYKGGREKADARVKKLLLLAELSLGDGKVIIDHLKSRYSNQYIFAKLSTEAIKTIVLLDKLDGSEIEQATITTKLTASEKKKLSSLFKSSNYAIYKVWLDHEVKALLLDSISTCKVDAAHVSFSAKGGGIVWAVIDSGVDENHPHFEKYNNLDLHKPLKHKDFSNSADGNALTDEYGHGTHVAGIIAGETDSECSTKSSKQLKAKEKHYKAFRRQRQQDDEIAYEEKVISIISGMAPECKLLSLKVLDENGKGKVSSIIAALNYIQELNGHGRFLQVHGVNLSVGYEFDPEWFGCGHSPLCVEVNRLVKSGVVVVVAAGNSGYAYANVGQKTIQAGKTMTINDPGNADLAITVGATHRSKPHTYGVSYFSSKGPTGDGRAKPDLVAPGEKILSCAAGSFKDTVQSKIAKKQKVEPSEVRVDFIEESGTSMAAPHVSGAIACFLSIRKEFFGQPEKVKEIFQKSATDLGRLNYFQGRGMVDLMRAIQSV